MKHTDNKGFTLVELLVAMVIGSIVLAVVVFAYALQVRSKNTQESLTGMNQTTRAALEIMASEIAKAGFDPFRSANAGILMAQANQLAFSMDIGDQTQPATRALLPDGETDDPNERVRYALTGTGHLGRTTAVNAADGTGGGVAQPLARNVDALDFVYLDANGNVTATLADIRSIEVTIVARSGELGGTGFTGRHTDATAYENQRGTVIFTAPGDSYRRLRLTTTIQTRNTGMI